MEDLDQQLDRSTGCLMAGAAGDALGAPVEFIDRRIILCRFGSRGIRDYAPAYGGIGKVTDDTQMTLFTAEGCLRAISASRGGSDHDPTEIMRGAYLRWLLTQGEHGDRKVQQTGWLIQQPELFSRRAPGNTCLSALRRIGGENNHSKGCGGIMRVAPCGIANAGSPETAYASGLDAAKLTHGHPTGYLSAAVFAATIAELMAGKPLMEAIQTSRALLLLSDGHEETLTALDAAVDLATANVPSTDAIPSLGEGWVAEEALAISLYCALTATGLEDGIITAVNITGDSDSTGAITGNLLGAVHGMAGMPPRWYAALELRDVIETVARDLVLIVHHHSDEDEADRLLRYPPT